MGACISVKAVDAEIVIVYKGKLKAINKRNISLAKLNNKVAKLTEGSGRELLSLSCSGNPVFIHDDSTWDYLKMTKKDLLVIMPAPEHALQYFDLTETGIEKLDMEYWVIGKNIKDFLDIVEGFDENLLSFVRAMSYLVIRSLSFQQFIVMFIVLMRPYTEKITKSVPYVVIKENIVCESKGAPEATDDPKQPIIRMPAKLYDIMTIWQMLMENIKDVEFQLNVVSNNLEVLLQERKHVKLLINKGKVVNLTALKRIENNLKIFYANEEIKRISEGFDNLRDCIANSVDLYSDERQKIVGSVEQINAGVHARDINEVSCAYGIADYASIPGDYRFI